MPPKQAAAAPTPSARPDSNCKWCNELTKGAQAGLESCSSCKSLWGSRWHTLRRGVACIASFEAAGRPAILEEDEDGKKTLTDYGKTVRAADRQWQTQMWQYSGAKGWKDFKWPSRWPIPPNTHPFLFAADGAGAPANPSPWARTPSQFPPRHPTTTTM